MLTKPDKTYFAYRDFFYKSHSSHSMTGESENALGEIHILNPRVKYQDDIAIFGCVVEFSMHAPAFIIGGTALVQINWSQISTSENDEKLQNESVSLSRELIQEKIKSFLADTAFPTQAPD